MVNPAARRAARREREAVDAIEAEGVRVQVVRTSHPGHAIDLCTAHAAGHDAVFSLGGDGTAMEALTALASVDTPVGILPGGTGNLVARALGISMSVGTATRSLIHGRAIAIDLGMLGDGRRFAFAAGVGVDAAMIAGTPRWLKRRVGVLAYTVAVVRSLTRLRRFTAIIEVDGVRTEREVVSVMVANFGVVLNRLLTLGPRIRPDDGRLDIIAFSPRGPLDVLRIFWRMFKSDFRDDVCVLYSSGTRVRIEVVPPGMAQADGELIGDTPLAISVMPRAARVLVPAGAAMM